MKSKIRINNAAAIFLVIAFLIAASIGSVITAGGISADEAGRNNIKPAGFYGRSEFSYVNPDDGKTWHVINKYFPVGSDDRPAYNMSSYTISGDSVIVINDYAGIPDDIQWDISLSGLIYTN